MSTLPKLCTAARSPKADTRIRSGAKVVTAACSAVSTSPMPSPAVANSFDLQKELADPERFEKVETRIRRGRSKLKGVCTNRSPDDRWEDLLSDPPQDDPDTELFEWGWNEADGEVVSCGRSAG